MSLRRLFSLCVTGSRWSGLIHDLSRQRWSRVSPTGMGPRRSSYDTRCAFLFPTTPYPPGPRQPYQNQHPVIGQYAVLASILAKTMLGAFPISLLAMLMAPARMTHTKCRLALKYSM